MERSNDPAGKTMILTVQLPDEIERRLRERASRVGRAVEDYVLRLIEQDAASAADSEVGLIVNASGTRLGGAVAPSDDEFELLLDQLSSGPQLPHLPADFSRADLYSDHD